MPHKLTLAILVLVLPQLPVSAVDSPPVQIGPGHTACGELKKFWRARPIIGRWMSEGFLGKAPVFHARSSFPYIKRPYGQEVDLADQLTTPRLLGGWHPDKGGVGELGRYGHVAEADLVYRKKDGGLAYRWNLLQLRLNRYARNGYTNLTLVLDQMPYCFTNNAKLETYGQATPPSDLREWKAFMREFCKELKRQYGEKTANGFRFRFGTELGDGKRIALTQEKLHTMYALTHQGIKEVLPGARLGAWNEAGYKSKQSTAPLKYIELARHAKTHNLDFAFAAVSSYAIPKVRGGNIANANPQENAEGDIAFFESVRALFPGLSAEYHEFGILNSQYNVATDEPGARGGAYRAHYLLTLLEHKSLDLLFHWDLFDSIGLSGLKDGKNGSDALLIKSNGWLYSILEHAAGGELYVLNRQDEKLKKGNGLYKSAYIRTTEKNYLIVSAYSVNRLKEEKRNICITIPAAILKKAPPPNGVIRYVTINPERDTIHRTLKADLAKAGNLQRAYAKHEDLFATAALMAKDRPKAKRMIEANYPRYRKAMEDSLTLKPFPIRLKAETDHYSLTFPIETSSVYVFVW